ncbi:MAG: hypothetical protein UV43_C0011G0014 [Parcubacteria group bacterium GW2011_GWF2_42_7]|nr:MAG: hypothetical protein UU01_C0002G0083 [Parcubacteria group bacterium GW2011_GWA2_40_37]KKS72901.1 MAG: hypothetical protein UV43_C0011G0014 [Parcubacteria group bacterium GW2011_GWF2_42_7]
MSFIYNGQMLKLGENIKDTSSPSPLPGEGRGEVVSFTKTNKLITAVYMVTDIIDKEEPLRNKLRTLGLEILSDPPIARTVLAIGQLMSFLDIASAVGIISEMNGNILKKEFLKLEGAIKESTDVKPSWLEGFLSELPLLSEEGNEGRSDPYPASPLSRGRGNHKGHTHLGVQKGSTLLKAIKDIHAPYEAGSFRSGFDLLKKERRYEITNFISKNGGSATITDIKNTKLNSLVSSSEKTLQRELLSMIKDGVLYKTGEKRWSRYFLK